jgi:hypothetical protein
MSMQKTIFILFILFLIIVTAGCGGEVSSQLTTASTGSATIYWNPVKTYNDNSSLIPAGYKILYGTASKHYTTTAKISIGQLTNTNSPSYTIKGLSRGTRYYFAVSAYDSSNIDSTLSTEVSKIIN